MREYIYFNGQQVAMIVFTAGSSAVYYIHNDHLGTPQKITNASQQVVWAADYEPFGNVSLTVNNLTFDTRFPGQHFDAESGLHYNYFRDYDPEIGRYIQSDPIGLGDGVNTYGYVHGNPVSGYDTDGLFGRDTVTNFCLRNPRICSPHKKPNKKKQCKDDDKDNDPECKNIQDEIRMWVQKFNQRAEDLRIDKCNQYELAYNTPNPSGNCGGATTWAGHQIAIKQVQNTILKLIKKALRLDCSIPSGAWGAASSGVPQRPRGR